MINNHKTISKGFILAGLVNFSVLIFSRFFTNSVLAETDPIVASDFGLLMIILWGLAYISVANSYQYAKWIVGVFAVEKIVYGVVWTNWIINHDVSLVFENDFMAGLFFSLYGINDWIFCVFFTVVFIKLIGKGKLVKD